jgi:hypothetical protein
VTNHFEDKITVVTNALSDKIENVSFGKDKGNVGGTFVLNDKNVEKYSGSAVGGKYDDVVLLYSRTFNLVFVFGLTGS